MSKEQQQSKRSLFDRMENMVKARRLEQFIAAELMDMELPPASSILPGKKTPFIDHICTMQTLTNRLKVGAQELAAWPCLIVSERIQSRTPCASR